MIKPWYNDVYPLPTKRWCNMNQSERNKEIMRRSIEESRLRENCKKIRLKKSIHKILNSKKGDEFFFQAHMSNIGIWYFLISKDDVFDRYIYVYRKDFDYVDE